MIRPRWCQGSLLSPAHIADPENVEQMIVALSLYVVVSLVMQQLRNSTEGKLFKAKDSGPELLSCYPFPTSYITAYGTHGRI